MNSLNTFEANGQSELKPARKKLYVKYMLSLRCKKIAKSELKKLGFRHTLSDGVIELREDLTQVQLDALKENLKKVGMDLLDEADSLLIDRIITTINELIHESDHLAHITFDEIFNKNEIFGSEHILKIFSEIMGISILHYIILQKIEKAKELLLYSDLSLPEIAYRLSYKNKYFLSAQLKKFTGLTPDAYREIKRKRESLLCKQ